MDCLLSLKHASIDIKYRVPRPRDRLEFSKNSLYFFIYACKIRAAYCYVAANVYQNMYYEVQLAASR